MSEIKFSCPVCGQNVLCDTTLAGTQLPCPHCNSTIGVPKGFEEPAEIPAAADFPPPLPDTIETTQQKTSALAIASLVCSLSSLITCIGWLPGVICGHLAKSHLRRNPSLKGNGLAKAGLIIGYAILVLEVGPAAVCILRFSAEMKQGYESVRQNLATNNIITQISSSTNISNIQPVEHAASEWIADINRANFPDHPASGQIHGNDFTVKAALFRNGDLRLNSTNGMAVDIIHGLDGSIEGQSYEFQSADDSSAGPRVKITWTEDGEVQSTTFSKGYALKLEFTHAKNRKLSGKIYLCLPDDSKSCVAGTLEVRLPKAK